jgi:NarL family two-component system response regulator LiaR
MLFPLSLSLEVTVSKCILIVDDHPSVRTLIRAFLESQTGFTVCGEAVDGLDALQKALHLHPDLIVLDVEMPRMNGLDAARVLRYLLPGVPIILFTVYHDRLPISDITELGIEAVISKTDSLDVLASHACRLLA